jgi:hypothetical protein
MLGINDEMSLQQCFRDAEKKLDDLNSRSKQLLSWIDDLAGAFKRSFMFDKYYFFLAGLIGDMQSIMYASYDEGWGKIILIALFDDNMIYLNFRDVAFSTPPYIPPRLSPFFVDILKQKVLETVKSYKAKIKEGHIIEFLFYPLQESIPIPAEFGDKPIKLSRNLEFNIRDESGNRLTIYTPLETTFGKEIEIIISELNLSALGFIGIPVSLKKGLQICGNIYIDISQLFLGVPRLMEECGYIVTEQDEPIVYQTLCEALNKVAEYGNYALDIIKKLALKGITVLTTALLY